MTQQKRKKEISLGEDFGDVILNVNGAHIEVLANGTVKMESAPANDAVVAKATLKIGDRMPDGTVFAGISPDTNKPMYATPADAPLTMKFNKATEYAAQLDAHGHRDWRVPTKAELNVLFNNRAAIGGFDVTGPHPAGWYWSASTGGIWDAWAQRFSDGCQLPDLKDLPAAVRCVR